MSGYSKMKLDNIMPAEKKFILWAEIGALLHDIGKLSNLFLEYRRGWQDCGQVTESSAQKKWGEHWNYDNDPHDHDFLDFDQANHLLKCYHDLWTCLNCKISALGWSLGDQTLKDLVDRHTYSLDWYNKHGIAPDYLSLILRTGDGKDAAENRNNPLFCREQLAAPQQATPFGWERDLNQNQDYLRGTLYNQLNSLLPEYWQLLSDSGRDFDDQNYRHALDDCRNRILDSFREAYRQGISDTCRPANDLTLWDHAYGTASLFKAFLAYLALGYNLTAIKNDEKTRMAEAIEKYGATDFNKGYFALLGFGWDGLSFLEKGEKIGDSVGRYMVLENLKEKLRGLVEVTFCLGNTIYRDENGIYFLIPQLGETENGIDPPALKPLVEQAKSLADKETGGELPLYWRSLPTTPYLNAIVAVMEDLRREWSVPWRGPAPAKVFSDWGKEGAEICPICRLRPLTLREKTDSGESGTSKPKICPYCQDIREKAKSRLDPEASPHETIFTGEIVGDPAKNPSRKAVLLAGCFGLQEWLNGRMLYSIFVREPGSMAAEVDRLPAIAGFSDDEKKRILIRQELWQKKGRTYQGFKDLQADIDELAAWGRYQDNDFKSFIGQYEGAIEDMYFKFLNWQKLLELGEFLRSLSASYGAPPSLDNFLLTQNHTPSRLLAVWEETEAFFKDTWNALPDELGLNPLPRAQLILDQPQVITGLPFQGIQEFFLDDGQSIEVMRIGARREFVAVNAPYEEKLAQSWRNKKIIEVRGEYLLPQKTRMSLTDCRITEVKRRDDLAFLPCRRLLVSPLVFLAMVPGNVALKAANFFRERYEKRFAKVKGRLPLSLGLVFFREHTPMFSVLDAGKRLIRNFEALHRRDPMPFSIQAAAGSPAVSFSLSSEGGIHEKAKIAESWDSKITSDPHYPYIMVRSGDGLENRASFYQSNLMGSLLHFRDLKENDTILARPNYLDMLFLDTTARRFDLFLADPGSGHPRRLPANFPYYLDELKTITDLWERLKQSRISDTGLRAMVDFLKYKLADWRADNGSQPWETGAWQGLVRTAVARAFNSLPAEGRENLEAAIHCGLLFDTLEIYYGILKERLRSARRES